MQVHDYAIIGHKRSEVGRWLGVAALALAPLLTGWIAVIADIPLLKDSLHGRLVAFTVSAGVVYTGLYWLFNRYLWKLLDKASGLPNLNGEWSVTGKTLNLEGNVLHNWTAQLIVTQRWDKMMVELRTSQSRSYSETASILTTHNNEAKLSYSYQNAPRVGEPELQKHQGFCELIFDADRQSASGRYSNFAGRTTIGSMELVRATSS